MPTAMRQPRARKQDVARLQAAFHSFAESSARMEQAYATLQERFVAVSRQLEETHRQLARKVSELRTLRERLDRADRLTVLGQMAASLAHEIRNPLHGIEGFASLLERDLEPDDRRRRFASNIVRGVRTLNHTVTDMLLYAGNRPTNRRPVHLQAVVEQALIFVMDELRRRGASDVRLNRKIAEPATVLADAEQLQRAVLNLVQNAVQATDGRGLVSITIRRDEADPGLPVVLEVSDNGCGIPEEDQQKLFQPFFTTKPGGTGLGLVVTKQIIERHGGTIRLSSKPGEGATFTVALPDADVRQRENLAVTD